MPAKGITMLNTPERRKAAGLAGKSKKSTKVHPRDKALLAQERKALNMKRKK